MRTRIVARTALGATALSLTLIAATGGCGGGPGAYLVDTLDLSDKPYAATLMPRPGR